MTTFDVRIWGIQEHKGKDRKTGKPRSTWRLRWVVAGKTFGDSFQTRALAESFRSRLIVAQREGVAFDESCGLPEPMARELKTRSWYQHATEYVDMKWPHASPNHRKGIAETLATVTPVLLSSDRGVPDEKTMRAALYGYVFNASVRAAGPPPAALTSAVTWLQANTVNLSVLTDAALVRKVLDTLALRMDGKPASAATVTRKRAVFSNALRYAVELRLLDVHPLSLVSWTAPKKDEGVDRAVVANPKQAVALLAAVAADSPELEAFFGCMYYAGLRPEEVLHLADDEFERPPKPGEWGWLHLTGATVAVGQGWSNDDQVTEHRGLKHRAKTATRSVPVAPPLAELLTRHIAKYEPADNGRLFVTRRGPGGRYVPTAGQPIPNNAYTTAWRKARKRALTPAQARSPLARRPYDLRHACLSTWLNAGVPATQVAEWAGNSVKVLLDVYAKCLDGGTAAALHRIGLALGLQPPPDPR
ncbi:tyrosine-type recombinase/integrase [Dactylosporangium roseum]|uniref:Tyrosine-type recombinase/integrase n=1 Tax=Dactylosporangium roseum TaxID=47989 RepID=A0ABY5Z3E4_9ACTN|nr:tyrosine-type recombinase/integrase [Dactylosporangium roseum]UWZ36091.1 tyrosine-type recombinase/integrase [Dactylosporangium roseum]